jgi:molybdopterin-binding protein
VDRIVSSRRQRRLRQEDLQVLGASLKRARHFVVAANNSPHAVERSSERLDAKILQMGAQQSLSWAARSMSRPKSRVCAPDPYWYYIQMKISARNAFEGTISKIVRGPVSTEVTIRISRKMEIVSVITTNSAKRLKLKKGQKAHALIKADSVIVGVD